MNADERRYMDELAEKVIGAAFEVSNVLGAGFLEKVYERAMAHELRTRGLRVDTQRPVRITYKGCVIGDYLADMIVEDRLLVELKCVEAFAPEHVAQCLNYLRATGLRLALLFNFQKPRVELRRVVLNF